MVAIVSQIQKKISLEEFLLLSETKPYYEYLNYGEIRQKPNQLREIK